MPLAKLIVKGPSIFLPFRNTVMGEPLSIRTDGNIIYVNSEFTDAQINALYNIATAYVSAHHSEGWGMALSDAMLFQRPVIATGYSGNMEFMNADNAMLVSYMEDYIREEDRFYLFTHEMKWAYPDIEDLESKIEHVYEHARDGALQRIVARASKDVAEFDGRIARDIMIKRLRMLK
jgi:glycosyltransferase involved in cell wall biosynthesis